MPELETKLQEVASEMKTFAEKTKEEVKNLGQVTNETKTALDAIRATMTTMQTQLDAVDAKTQQRHVAAPEYKSVGSRYIETPEFLQWKEDGFTGRRPIRMSLKSSLFERKTNITETGLGSATSGVLVQQRIPGVVDMPMQALRIRDMMQVRPQSTGNSFDWVYLATQTNAASPQVEAVAKAQSYYNWQTASGAIRTIAHYVKVSRQSLDDVAFLRGKIDSELMYGLKIKEEDEILSGDGTGVHLNGFITQATAFDTNYLVAGDGWEYLDVLRYAKLQARLAGLANYAPSAYVLNPTDLAKIEASKDTTGRYVVGDPKTGAQMTMIWGLPVVESDSITAGTFLVGAFNTAAELIDRQQATIEIAYQNDTDFVANLATILCEERIGLAVTKATAFITGPFTTSPA